MAKTLRYDLELNDAKMSAEITRLDKKVDGLRKSTKELTKAEKIDYDQISKNKTLIKGYSSQLTKLRNQQIRGTKTTNTFGKAFSSFPFKFNFLGNAMATLAGVGIGGVIAGFKKLMNIINGFSNANSKLASVLLTTKDGIKGLTDEAIRLGASSKFTATQITQMMTEFAKAGFTQQEIKDVAGATSDLAMALDVELANSAELVTSAMKGFGLSTKDTSHIAEVLGVVTTKTRLSFESLTTALPYVATSAHTANVSLEETTAMLGMLVDRGIDASTAGTQLRKIFGDLAKSGMSFEEAMNLIATSEDQAKTAIDLFGIRAKDAGIILAGTGDKTADLTGYLNNLNGELKQMADVQMDNLSSDVTLLGSAWEAFILNLEQGDGVISRTLRSLTQGLTGALDQLQHIGLSEKQYQGMKKAEAFKLAMSEQAKRDAQEFDMHIKRLGLEDAGLMKLAKTKLSFLEVDRNRLKYLEDIKNKQGQLDEKGQEEIISLKTRIKAVNEYANNYVNQLGKKAKETEKEVEAEKEANKTKADNYKKYLEQRAETKKIFEDLEAEQNTIKAEAEAEKQAENQTAEFDRMNKHMAKVTEQTDAEVQENQKKNDKIKQQDEELWQHTKAGLRNLTDTGIALYNHSSEMRIAGLDEEQKALDDKLDKGLISQKSYDDKTKAIKKKQFEEQQKTKISNIWINAGQAVVGTWAGYSEMGPYGAIIAAIQTAAILGMADAQANSVRSQKFYGEKGGMIYGNSHANGGVDVNMEDGEYLVKKTATTRYKPLLNDINNEREIFDYDRLANAMQSKQVFVTSHDISNQQKKDVKVTNRVTF